MSGLTKVVPSTISKKTSLSDILSNLSAESTLNPVNIKIGNSINLIILIALYFLRYPNNYLKVVQRTFYRPKTSSMLYSPGAWLIPHSTAFIAPLTKMARSVAT